MILKFVKIGVDNMTEMNVATNDQVEAKINDKESIILDVREPAEYAMQHIPNSTLIPLGELENRLDEIDKDKTVYVIVRTCKRSCYAGNLMLENDYNEVNNFLLVMINWIGPTESKF